MDLKDLCHQKLKEKGLHENRAYKRRLDFELDEIKAQDKESYFLGLVGKKVKKNKRNLMVPWLLSVVDEYDINKWPESDWHGDLPDIDIDYIPQVREYLKNVWAPKEFGEDKVCNISTYTTFGIKSSLLDMAKIHGQSRDELLTITKNLEEKDEDGRPLDWDASLRLNKDLQKYCEAHPDIAEAAKKLINRNRGKGVHAGGLIISSKPLADFVPLVRDKDNPQAAAWPEGLSRTDLQPVGLVKFDFLVITNNLQVAWACELIKERHGITSINAKPGLPNWSDLGYLNDSAAIALANKADLKCIFQFDGEGIQKLVAQGGVTSFHDLVAFTALYRPGPLGVGMAKAYVRRKKGEERYELHPLLTPILGNTYGVLCYQEQIMQILNIVGDIPLKDCEAVRKAISKKKIEVFSKYKEKFVANGQIKLGYTKEKLEEFWDQIESFAEYGFNKSVTKNTLIPYASSTYGDVSCKKIEDFKAGDLVFSVNEAGETVETEVVALHDHGMLEAFEITFDDGYSMACSINHKFLTEEGQKPLWEILGSNSSILCDTKIKEKINAQEKNEWMGFPLRSNFCKSGNMEYPPKMLSKMSREVVYNGVLESPLWSNIQNKNIDKKTSANLREMQIFSLEIGWGNNRKTFGSLSNGIAHISGVDCSSTKLRSVQYNKTEEHNEEESSIESIGITKSNSFKNSKKDFGKTRNSTIKSRKVTTVEGTEPQKICSMHRSSLEKSKVIQNGDLASETIELGYETNSLRKRSKTSRFCKGKYLDRSGWILSLQRMFGKETKVVSNPSSGCDVECGSDSPQKDYVNSDEHGMFCEFDWGNETGMVGVAAGHDKIKNTRSLVHRKIVRVVSLGKRQMYDLEVACPTHNFILPTGVVTSNSHAVCYTYLSSRLLWLKAHYKPEFFCAILTFEKDTDKIKEYKIEAGIHKVLVKKADINKSGASFRLDGDDIYYGLSSIKGIGIERAKEIESLQPFSGFEDFLDKFGTDATVIKPLIGLRCFHDADPVTLWKFVEEYRDKLSKIEAAKSRYKDTIDKHTNKLKELLVDYPDLAEFNDDNLLAWESKFDFDVKHEKYTTIEEEVLIDGVMVTVQKNVKEDIFTNLYTELSKLYTKWKKANDNYIKKNDFKHTLPKLKDFDAASFEISETIETELKNVSLCEEKYYGFEWTSKLENSPDFDPKLLFNQFNDDSIAVATIAVEIKAVQKKQGKKATYYLVTAADANGKVGFINVWQDDMERWEDEIKVGNLLKMQVRPPSEGFSTYTFKSFPRHEKWKLPKNKKDDYRIVTMAEGIKLEEQPMTEEEIVEQFKEL